MSAKAFTHAVAIAVLTLAACEAAPSASEETLPFDALNGPSATAVLGGLALELRTSAATYSQDEPIQLAARLQFRGPGDATTIYGLGAGLIVFDIEQLDGTIQLPAVWPGECRDFRIQRATPYEGIFAKSGSFANDSPDAAFYRAYFNDPVLRLPVGRWRVTARVEGSENSCAGRSIRVEASLSVEVAAD